MMSKFSLLAFFVGEEQTVVFLLVDGQISAWIRPIGQAALQRQVGSFRRLIQKNPQNQAGELSKVEKAGQDLYHALLVDALDSIRKPVVYVAPHGPLHYLPFAALHDGSRYLMEKSTLLNIPSGTVLTYLAKKPLAANGSTVVFANPDLGNPNLDLPYAEREGQAVRARRPQAILLTRKEAQEAKARKLGQEAGILHFATHGKFDDTRPMDSALLLAEGDGDDGTLTASEIFGLALPGSLVVLSACETGLSQIATGDEILGMTRAFMYAGARQVIATLWEIDDQATSELMDQLYAGLAKESPASALRAAQTALRTRYPHPFYWAGFVSYGLFH
jgi:CHAT domain-containing protein